MNIGEPSASAVQALIPASIDRRAFCRRFECRFAVFHLSTRSSCLPLAYVNVEGEVVLPLPIPHDAVHECNHDYASMTIAIRAFGFGYRSWKYCHKMPRHCRVRQYQHVAFLCVTESEPLPQTVSCSDHWNIDPRTQVAGRWW